MGTKGLCAVMYSYQDEHLPQQQCVSLHYCEAFPVISNCFFFFINFNVHPVPKSRLPRDSEFCLMWLQRRAITRCVSSPSVPMKKPVFLWKLSPPEVRWITHAHLAYVFLVFSCIAETVAVNSYTNVSQFYSTPFKGYSALKKLFIHLVFFKSRI